MNKIDLTKHIADLLGDLVLEGTVDASDAESIVDQELTLELADQPRGHHLYIHTSVAPSGCGPGSPGYAADQSRIVASFNTASMAAIVTPTFSAIPTTGDQYFLTEKVRWDTYSRAIDLAVITGRRQHLKPFMATFSVVATQYVYDVPSGFSHVNRLMLVPSGTTDYTLTNTLEVPRNGWTIKQNPLGSYSLYVNRSYIYLFDYDTEIIQVHGMRMVPTLATPTTNCEIPEDFIVNHTLMQLSARNMGNSEEWLRRYYAYERESKRLASAIRTPLPADSVKLP